MFRRKLRSFLNLGFEPGDLTDREFRQLRVITVSTSLFLGIALASMLQTWLIGELRVLGFLVGSTVAGLGNLALLKVTRRPALSGHIAIAILAALITFSAVVSGGFFKPSFGWVYILPLAAAVVLDTRSAVAWTVATIGIATGFWWIAENGIDLSVSIDPALQSHNALADRLLTLTSLGILGIAFAMTHHRAQEKLEREKIYLELIMQAAVTANRARSLSDALETSVREVCQTMGWQVGQALEVRPNGECVGTPHRVWKLPGNPPPGLLGSPGELFELPMPRLAIESGLPQIAASIGVEMKSDGRTKMSKEIGLASSACIPICVGDQVRALLEFGSAEPLRERDIRHLRDVFTHIGIELGRVAERTDLQDQVRHKQKMAAVGQLAAGIAHEVNNPMSFVRSNLHAIHGALTEEHKAEGEGASDGFEDLKELVEDSLEGVERTISIVRDMVRFSRSGGGYEGDWEKASVDELVADSLRVASTDAPPGVRFMVETDPADPIVCAPNALRQVFLNLILNAVHAVDGGGVVRVATEASSGGVLVRVEDDGPGVPSRDAERVFEPFFTTKPEGHGAGLGLSVSFEIVSRHGGEIRVDRSADGGASFSVWLPRSAPEAASV